MISARYRCVFVHVPRTGGTSIEQALGWFDRLAYDVQDHRTVGALRGAMAPEDFAAYFKFTFVRNPWDRVASWYKNVMEDPVHQEHFGVPAGIPFTEFVRDHAGIWGLQPQLDWIREPGRDIELDFIGRFERLAADFRTVCRRLGTEDLTLSHQLQSDDRTLYAALYDEASRTLVGTRYAEEIAMFDYRFAE